ncbi:MAG TPA: hypothetical protein VK176_06955 [Phycisphaerales bacterium]|nr:hypothetical protein [Phycisphaerales bacterium]
MVVDHTSTRSRRSHTFSWRDAALSLSNVRRSLAMLLIAGVCAGPMATVAHAQFDTLPNEVTSATSALSGEQAAAVKSYAQKYVDQLTVEGEGDSADQAKRLLVEPLNRMSVTPSFRLEYARALSEKLRAMSQDGKAENAIRALFIAGDLATETSIAIAESQLTAKDDGTRAAAAVAMRRTFEAVKRFDPAISTARLATSLDAVGNALRKEADPQIYRELSRAVSAAMQIDRAGHENVRNKAAAVLSDALGARLRELEGAIPETQTAYALVGAATDLRSVLGQEGQLGAEGAKAAAGFAGDLLVNISKVIKKGGLSTSKAEEDPSRALAVQMSLLAEQIITLASARTSAAGAAVNLSNFLRSGEVNDDAKFTLGLNEVVDRLTKAPFSHPADRFK